MSITLNSLLDLFKIGAVPILMIFNPAIWQARTQETYLNNFSNSQVTSVQMPLNRHHFLEENIGQISGSDASKVKYISRDSDLDIFVLNTGLSYQFHKLSTGVDENNNSKNFRNRKYSRKNQLGDTYRMDMKLIDANPKAKITTEEKSEGVIHYSKADLVNVKSYKKVTFHNIYPHIDWVIYRTSGNLKYDFIVHPKGDPKKIKIQVKWANRIEIDDFGNLTISCPLGKITEEIPKSFQKDELVSSSFQLREDTLTFKIGDYDTSKVLRIDPEVQWSTYYGGGSNDVAHNCVTDDKGNIYVAGYTNSTNNIADGGYQNTLSDSTDAFLVKFNSLGERQWATYFGGSGYDVARSCALDSFGNIYLSGRTSSSNLAFNGFQNSYNGGNSDAFLVKFDSNGLLIWSTYFGGLQDDEGSSCSVDKNNNVYLAGVTNSISNITSSGFQNNYGGGSSDAFIAKFDTSGNRIWSTYYGGTSNDVGMTCKVDRLNNVYLGGYTGSQNNIASNGHQNMLSGGQDSFLVKFDSLGLRSWATYYGGNENDGAYDCALDSIGNVYISGYTYSDSGIAFNGHQEMISSPFKFDAFLVKFNSAGIRKWATYYGGEENDTGSSCTTDALGNVFLAGSTNSSINISYEGSQNIYNGGGYDAYLVKFDSTGTRVWATYYGGSQFDTGLNCAVDNNGYIYMVGSSSSLNLSTGNSHQEIKGGFTDGFITKFHKDDETSDVQIDFIENVSSLVKIFPNPLSNNELTVLVENQNLDSIEIYNSNGKLVFQSKINNKQETINLERLNPGTYNIIISNINESKVFHKKIIIH